MDGWMDRQTDRQTDRRTISESERINVVQILSDRLHSCTCLGTVSQLDPSFGYAMVQVWRGARVEITSETHQTTAKRHEFCSTIAFSPAVAKRAPFHTESVQSFSCLPHYPHPDVLVVASCLFKLY